MLREGKREIAWQSKGTVSGEIPAAKLAAHLTFNSLIIEKFEKINTQNNIMQILLITYLQAYFWNIVWRGTIFMNLIKEK